MSYDGHEILKYQIGMPYGATDPVTKAAFRSGENVVLCQKNGNLISLRSLIENNYYCPLCDRKLNQNLAAVGRGEVAKQDKKGANAIPLQPQRPQSTSHSSSTNFWAGLTLVMFVCIAAGVIIFFQSISNRGSTPAQPPVYLTATDASYVQFPTSTFVPSGFSNIPSTSTPDYSTNNGSSIDNSGSSFQTSTPFCSSTTLSFNHTSKGYLLHIVPCNGSEYDLGPIAYGAAAVGPNNHFLVYVSASDGKVYAAQIGDQTLTQIADLKREYSFSAFLRNDTPSFVLSFSSSEPYQVTIQENIYNNSATVSVPQYLSQ
jgi:hypothetical protein